MGSVYVLTLRQLSGKWRILIMSVLASLPVLVAVVTVNSSTAPPVGEFEAVALSGMLAGSISPLIVLAIATTAFANEIEDKTLANLTLSPIPRWKIVVPKFLAVVTVSGPFVAISALLTSHFAFSGDASASAAVTASAVVGVLLYASVFVWTGLVTTQAIGIGLLYIVIWEGFFAGFVVGVRVLSIRHYSIGWMHGLDARRFASAEHLSFGTVIAVSAIVFVGFLWLSVRRLKRMDVP